ncbi:MAG: hypothetical protein M0P91_11930 [Sulfuricurvum sp.]|jgi:hypothetical protein|uniref:hypothetical protein n=1 Tax=Sulfuricurvum sp. TaxID=2025608 RepID=UPI0025CD3081|nr:hypothetical protein [Sulfuricurvum sp.]MCK9373897.1 hypothetical protein [Sulfuricurvum sp.]
MKKFLLLIPVGLLAATGVFWASLTHTHTINQRALTPAKIQKEMPELFSDSEHYLRQIIRHGDAQSLSPLYTSLDTIKEKITQHEEKGVSVAKVEKMFSLYLQDSRLLTQKITPHLETLRQLDYYEDKNEENFITALDQIGLYELKSAYANLDQIRQDYLKTPSLEIKSKYEAENQRIQGIIRELYLDNAIEKPLYTYLNNHYQYLQTIASAYDHVGYERINRLRTNGYAIKAQLQLLPSS